MYMGETKIQEKGANQRKIRKGKKERNNEGLESLSDE